MAKPESFIVICPDSAKMEKLKEVLSPLYPKTLYASTIKDAEFKMENQNFPLFILDGTKPVLDKSSGIFAMAQKNFETKGKPWIVLNSGVESEDKFGIYPFVKFLPNDWNGETLYRFLDNVLVSEQTLMKTLIDVRFVNPIMSAVIEVLSTMAQVNLDKGAPYIRKKAEPPKTRGDISGIVAVNSDQFNGSLALTFTEPLALKIYNNMVGEDKTAIDEDVKDAIMELTNVIFGNAKRDLNKEGHSIRPAIPSLISGKNHEVRHSTQGHCLCLPFSGDVGELHDECMVSTP